MDTFLHFFSGIALTLGTLFGFAAPVQTAPVLPVPPPVIATSSVDTTSKPHSSESKPTSTVPTVTVSATNTPGADESLSPTDPSLGFTVHIPAGWSASVARQGNSSSSLTLLSSIEYEKDTKGDQYKTNDLVRIGRAASWTTGSTAVTPQQYVDEKMQHYAADSKLIFQKQITLGGLPAHYRRNLKSGAQIATIFVLHNHQEFSIIYLPVNLTWTAKQDEILDSLIASFAFTE